MDNGSPESLSAAGKEKLNRLFALLAKMNFIHRSPEHLCVRLGLMAVGLIFFLAISQADPTSQTDYFPSTGHATQRNIFNTADPMRADPTPQTDSSLDNGHGGNIFDRARKATPVIIDGVSEEAHVARIEGFKEGVAARESATVSGETKRRGSKLDSLLPPGKDEYIDSTGRKIERGGKSTIDGVSEETRAAWIEGFKQGRAGQTPLEENPTASETTLPGEAHSDSKLPTGESAVELDTEDNKNTRQERETEIATGQPIALLAVGIICFVGAGWYWRSQLPHR